MRPGRRIARAIELLMDEAGPTLRYLTAAQLIGDARLAGQLRKRWREDLVGAWLDALRPDLPIHGGRDDTFETVTGKLFELGAHRETLPLTRGFAPYLARLDHEPRTMLDNLFQILIASAAARLGFDVSQYALRRLAVLHGATRERDFAVYRKRGSYRMPAGYKEYPVVEERFAPNGIFGLPYVHDFYLLNHTAFARSARRTYAGVARFVLDGRYQRLHHGFGYVEERSRSESRWYVAGWKADFPDLLIRWELMANLPRSVRWRPDFAPYEEEFGWLFPRDWLIEQSPGYWVAGKRMALTPGQRGAHERKLESTFRAARLLGKY